MNPDQYISDAYAELYRHDGSIESACERFVALGKAVQAGDPCDRFHLNASFMNKAFTEKAGEMRDFVQALNSKFQTVFGSRGLITSRHGLRLVEVHVAFELHRQYLAGEGYDAYVPILTSGANVAHILHFLGEGVFPVSYAEYHKGDKPGRKKMKKPEWRYVSNFPPPKASTKRVLLMDDAVEKGCTIRAVQAMVREHVADLGGQIKEVDVFVSNYLFASLPTLRDMSEVDRGLSIADFDFSHFRRNIEWFHQLLDAALED